MAFKSRKIWKIFFPWSSSVLSVCVNSIESPKMIEWNWQLVIKWSDKWHLNKCYHLICFSLSSFFFFATLANSLFHTHPLQMYRHFCSCNFFFFFFGNIQRIKIFTNHNCWWIHHLKYSYTTMLYIISL